MTVNELSFKDALSRFATGVCVVTTMGADGAPRRADDQRLYLRLAGSAAGLFCLGCKSDALIRGARDGRFAINILAEDQEEVSETFASQTRRQVRRCRPWRGRVRLPDDQRRAGCSRVSGGRDPRRRRPPDRRRPGRAAPGSGWQAAASLPRPLPADYLSACCGGRLARRSGRHAPHTGWRYGTGRMDCLAIRLARRRGRRRNQSSSS